MASVCFYFQAHQPDRLRHYQIFETDSRYFDDYKNELICKKVAQKCYLPANKLFLELIKRFEGRFKVSYSLTGVLIEQLMKYCPEVVDSFVDLAETGCVEFLGETYYHSLSYLYSKKEFFHQIERHSDLIENLFGQKPKVFRNTELIYNNELARAIEDNTEFIAVLAEGAKHILGYRSPNYTYSPPGCKRMSLLLKNFTLSDDIAFRFSNRGWKEWPLTVDKYVAWLNAINGDGYTVNLFMDYETFGEHQWEDTGIFEFLRHLPAKVLENPDNDFKTPSEVVEAYPPVGEFDAPYTISWADIERDLSAWLGNEMQTSAIDELYRMEKKVHQTRDEELITNWRRLQTSDHFYYMCTKYFSDGDVHKYFNPFDSPYDSYINFMNVLSDLDERCQGVMEKKAAKSRRSQKKLVEKSA